MWNTLLTVLVDCLIFWGGTRFGYRMAFLKKDKEKDPSICSCDHAFSVHKENGTCNVVKVVNHMYKYECPCVRYDGIPPAHVFLKDA